MCLWLSDLFQTIAAKYVPGKSAEQCQEKFKSLVAAAKVFFANRVLFCPEMFGNTIR
jgi:hypothetical protein